jgi:hypothetical protein
LLYWYKRKNTDTYAPPQSKEALGTTPANFGSKFELTAADVRKLVSNVK